MSNQPASLQEVTDSYNVIHKSIIAALGATSQSSVVEQLMTEDRVAYAAYKSAMSAALNPDDPTMSNMVASLKNATGIIDTTAAALKKIEDVAAKIDRAVGILAKVAALLTR
jgi:hypothetical protein